MNQKVIITTIGIIAIIVVIYISFESYSMQVDTRTAFVENCREWKQDIEQERIRLENNWFANYDSFNQWVSEYNRECAS